ncbi:ribokinase [Pseudonocardia alaniniphila]|uniref:Ribokinase n=1 Tax=Pseudonocardia alaniniphila TaxID=75291 RepID=A0ABS9TC01_9PSEU|nr:ribokinase [Pseudonocardia alaniniphila]MCH6165928.1 ribokinase [Pseudonocardia alaniniphila]
MPRIAVVGSVNLDLVARVPRLPAPGETLAAGDLRRVPGGKGANQALAARRLGADVTLVAAVGDDAACDEALALLQHDGVRLDGLRREHGHPTGHALITVDDSGETTIVVAAGANATLDVSPDDVRGADAVLTVLEIPDTAVAAAVQHATGLVVLNAAPARALPSELLRRIDLVVVNTAEYAAIEGLDAARAVAVTAGAKGAVLRRDGREVAAAQPPPVDVVDGTAAGDAFTAALTVALLDGASDPDAMRRACAAGALAVTKAGAQPSLPTAAELEAVL